MRATHLATRSFLLLLAAWASSAVSAGCVTIRTAPEVESIAERWPPPAACGRKASVGIVLGGVGSLDYGKISEEVVSAFEESGLFGSVQLDPDDRTDYVVAAEATLEAKFNPLLEIGAPLSLYLAPTWSSEAYWFRLSVYDRDENLVDSFLFEGRTRLWKHMLFIFAAPFARSMETQMRRTFRDFARAAIVEVCAKHGSFG